MASTMQILSVFFFFLIHLRKKQPRDNSGSTLIEYRSRTTKSVADDAGFCGEV